MSPICYDQRVLPLHLPVPNYRLWDHSGALDPHQDVGIIGPALPHPFNKSKVPPRSYLEMPTTPPKRFARRDAISSPNGAANEGQGFPNEYTGGGSYPSDANHDEQHTSAARTRWQLQEGSTFMSSGCVRPYPSRALTAPHPCDNSMPTSGTQQRQSYPDGADMYQYPGDDASQRPSDSISPSTTTALTSTSDVESQVLASFRPPWVAADLLGMIQAPYPSLDWGLPAGSSASNAAYRTVGQAGDDLQSQAQARSQSQSPAQLTDSLFATLNLPFAMPSPSFSVSTTSTSTPFLDEVDALVGISFGSSSWSRGTSTPAGLTSTGGTAEGQCYFSAQPHSASQLAPQPVSFPTEQFGNIDLANALGGTQQGTDVSSRGGSLRDAFAFPATSLPASSAWGSATYQQSIAQPSSSMIASHAPMPQQQMQAQASTSDFDLASMPTTGHRSRPSSYAASGEIALPWSVSPQRRREVTEGFKSPSQLQASRYHQGMAVPADPSLSPLPVPGPSLQSHRHHHPYSHERVPTLSSISASTPAAPGRSSANPVQQQQRIFKTPLRNLAYQARVYEQRKALQGLTSSLSMAFEPPWEGQSGDNAAGSRLSGQLASTISTILHSSVSGVTSQSDEVQGSDATAAALSQQQGQDAGALSPSDTGTDGKRMRCKQRARRAELRNMGKLDASCRAVLDWDSQHKRKRRRAGGAAEGMDIDVGADSEQTAPRSNKSFESDDLEADEVAWATLRSVWLSLRAQWPLFLAAEKRLKVQSRPSSSSSNTGAGTSGAFKSSATALGVGIGIGTPPASHQTAMQSQSPPDGGRGPTSLAPSTSTLTTTPLQEFLALVVADDNEASAGGEGQGSGTV